MNLIESSLNLNRPDPQLKVLTCCTVCPKVKVEVKEMVAVGQVQRGRKVVADAQTLLHAASVLHVAQKGLANRKMLAHPAAAPAKKNKNNLKISTYRYKYLLFC